MAKKRNLNIIPPLCACGCGRLVGTNRRGEYNKYLKGHNSKRLGLSKPSKNASTGRFKPGNTFGKGRPQGSRNNVTLAAANIFNDESETIARKAVEMALAGNTAMVKLIVERILPIRKSLPIKLDGMPVVKSVSDASKLSEFVLDAISTGKISPLDGEILSRSCERHLRALQVSDLEERLQQVENLLTDNN
jgi:hypothetical protein